MKVLMMIVMMRCMVQTRPYLLQVLIVLLLLVQSRSGRWQERRLLARGHLLLILIELAAHLWLRQ